MMEENINILPNFEKLLKPLEYFRSNFYHNFQVNTCPIDRGVFQFIIVYNRIGGHEIAREKIKQKVAEDAPAEGNIDSVLKRNQEILRFQRSFIRRYRA